MNFYSNQLFCSFPNILTQILALQAFKTQIFFVDTLSLIGFDVKRSHFQTVYNFPFNFLFDPVMI